MLGVYLPDDTTEIHSMTLWISSVDKFGRRIFEQFQLIDNRVTVVNPEQVDQTIGADFLQQLGDRIHLEGQFQPTGAVADGRFRNTQSWRWNPAGNSSRRRNNSNRGNHAGLDWR